MPYKKCTKNHENGVRAKTCSVCGEAFIFKTSREKKEKGKDVDWATLQPGQRIRILTGSGPYMDIIRKGKEIRKYLGCKGGVYHVVSVHKDGIKILNGFLTEFCYMGEVCEGQVGIKSPHRIKLL